MRALNFRLRSAETSSMTSSSLSDHSWVVIQSLPLKSAVLISNGDLLQPGDVGEVDVARVGDRFDENSELVIRQHVEQNGCGGAGLGLKRQRLVAGRPDFDNGGRGFEVRVAGGGVQGEDVRLA